MFFRLETSSYIYSDDKAKKLEQLGFIFRDYQFDKNKKEMINISVTIEINTLDDLITFSKEFGSLIVSDDLIKIYDGTNE